MIDIARWGSARLGSAEGGAQRELSPWLLNRRGNRREGDRSADHRDQNNESQHRERDRLRHHGPSFAG